MTAEFAPEGFQFQLPLLLSNGKVFVWGELTMKKSIWIMSLILSSSALASERVDEHALQSARTPTFFDITRNSDGSVKLMAQREAYFYCLEQKAHLPRLRELALLATNYGAKGIVASSYGEKEWHRLITKPEDDFYYSVTGYQRPAGDMGNCMFWSSSVSPLYGDTGFVIVGSTGSLSPEYNLPDHRNAVRCVSGK